MRVTCTRRLQFCCGHRVAGHESKCSNLHGHNYVVYFEAEAEALDELGRVIDFGVLKERLGEWIDECWDHGFVLWERDDEALKAMQAMQDQKLFVLPHNPTAENMAAYLLEDVCPIALHGTGVRVVRIELHETENCKAEVME